VKEWEVRPVAGADWKRQRRAWSSLMRDGERAATRELMARPHSGEHYERLIETLVLEAPTWDLTFDMM
jgi:hypothetical protein